MKSTANLHVKLLVTFLLLCKIVFTHSFLSRTPQHIDRGWHKTLWDELPIGHLLIKCNIPQHLYLIHLQKQKTRTYQIQWTLPISLPTQISTHSNTNGILIRMNRLSDFLTASKKIHRIYTQLHYNQNKYNPTHHVYVTHTCTNTFHSTISAHNCPS